MKAVFALLFIIVLGASALANTGTTVNIPNPKIETYEQVTTLKMDIFLDSGIVVATDINEVEYANEKSIARLYKYKNSRIKKALAFSTKRNKAKMS